MIQTFWGVGIISLIFLMFILSLVNFTNLRSHRHPVIRVKNDFISEHFSFPCFSVSCINDLGQPLRVNPLHGEYPSHIVSGSFDRVYPYQTFFVEVF